MRKRPGEGGRPPPSRQVQRGQASPASRLHRHTEQGRPDPCPQASTIGTERQLLPITAPRSTRQGPAQAPPPRRGNSCHSRRRAQRGRAPRKHPRHGEATPAIHSAACNARGPPGEHHRHRDATPAIRGAAFDASGAARKHPPHGDATPAIHSIALTRQARTRAPAARRPTSGDSRRRTQRRSGFYPRM
jgi:hypothetical protein